MMKIALGLIVGVCLSLGWSPAHAQTGGVALPRAGWMASASSGSDSASKAIDGNASSRWSSGADQTGGQWFKLDMLSPQTFSQVTIDCSGSSSDYMRSYEIYVSTDGTTWTTPIASGNGSGPIITAVFSPQTARYLALVQTGVGSNWWSIHELNVYSGSVQTAVLSRAGWTASASVTGGSDVPSKALDGASTTRWSTGASQVNGQSFQVDMQRVQTFVGVTLDSGGYTSDYPRAYQLFATNDTTNWGAAIATGAGTASLLTINSPKTSARYLKVVQTGSSSNWWSIAELNVIGVADPQPTALTFSRSEWSATAVLTCQSDVPSNAFDGSISTRWSTGVPQANGQWFLLDMKTSSVFSRITIDSGSSSGDYMRAFQVFTGDDPANLGAAIASGNGTSALVDISFAPARGRYIKLVLTGGSSNWWSIHELSVYGAPPALLPPIGWSTSAFQSQGGDVAARALDGSITTRWSSGTNQVPNQWFQIDMLSSQTISQVVLDAGGSSNDYPRGYQLYASNSTNNWGPPLATGAGTSTIVSISFPPTTARYLRIVQTGMAGNWWSIHELRVLRSSPVPYLSCVAARDNGYTAVFGYVNAPDANQEVVPGPLNQVLIDGLSPLSPVQPRWFGTSNESAFMVDFLDNVSWQIGGSGATARSNSTPCLTFPSPQGIRVSLPDGSTPLLKVDLNAGIVATDTLSPGVTVGRTDGAFAVTADGAATYHIPFWVPAGRAGLEPTVGLTYNSRAGISPSGLGWSLDAASQITRCGERLDLDGVSRAVHYDNLDKICLDGKRLKIVQGNGLDGTIYMAIDTNFSRIVQHGNGQVNTTFEVLMKSGNILTFGGDSATFSVTVNGQTLDDSWSLRRIRDRSGNKIDYTYSNTPREIRLPAGLGAIHAGVEHLLQRIDYVYSLIPFTSSTSSRSVVFNYQDRPQPEVLPIAGATHVLFSRIKSVDMMGPDPVSTGVLKSYSLQYTAGSVADRELLHSVTECNGAAGASGVVCKRPTTFVYSDEAAAWTKKPHVYTESGTTIRSDEQVVDIDGDGRDDVLFLLSTNPHRVSKSNGGNETITEIVWDSHFIARLSDGTQLGPEVDLSATGVLPAYNQLMRFDFYAVDLNADGKSDLVAPQPEGISDNLPFSYTVFHNVTQSSLTPDFDADVDPLFTRDFRIDAPLGSVPREPRPQFVDLNGDGFVDIALGSRMRTSGTNTFVDWTILKGRPTGGFQTIGPVPVLTDILGTLEIRAVAQRTMQRAGTDLLVHGSFLGTGNAVTLSMDGSDITVSARDSGLPLPGLSGDQSAAFQWLFADVNGDGLEEAVAMPFIGAHMQDGILQPCPDTNPECVHPGTVIFPFRPNLGGRFAGSFGAGSTSHVTAGLGAWTMDWDQDGRDDIVLDSDADRETFYSTDKYKANISVLRSTGYGFSSPVVITDAAGQKIPGLYTETATSVDNIASSGHPYTRHYAKRIDINGDGISDILVGPDVYVRETKRPNLLTGVVDGLGHDMIVKYNPIADKTLNGRPGEPFYQKTASCDYPRYCVNHGLWAVSEVDVDDGTGLRFQDPATCTSCGKTPSNTYNTFYYSYADGASSLVGDGWLGFGAREVLDVNRSMTSRTTYDNTSHTVFTHFAKKFLPATELKTVLLPSHDGGIVANAQIVYQHEVTHRYRLIKPASIESVVGVVPDSEVDEEREISVDGVTVTRHLETSYEYDTQVNSDNGGYGNETYRKLLFSNGEMLEKRTTYLPATSDYLVARIDTVTNTSTPLENDEPQTRTLKYDYYDASPLVFTETVEPFGDATKYLKRTYNRDIFGMIRSTVESDLSGKTRRASTEYDADNVFPSSTTSGVGLKTRYFYHPGFGVLELSVDPNGAASSMTYDRFGRIKSSQGPDGTATSTQYLQAASSLQSYTVRTLGSDNHLDATTYDRLARPVDRMTRNAGGATTHATTGYDSCGRVSGTTIPANEGDLSLAQTQILYDARDRAIATNRLDLSTTGRQVDSYNFYKGLAVTTFDPATTDVSEGLGRAKHVKTYDEHGRLRTSADVRDSSGSSVVTTFSYGAFDNLRTTRTQGPNGDSGITTLVYDNLGRRTSVQDPDTGLMTYVSDPWGNVVSTVDANQRTTTFEYDEVNRPKTETTQQEGTSVTVWDTAPHGLGKVAVATSAPGLGGTYQKYTYDPIGRQIAEKHGVSSSEYTVGFSYLPSGAHTGKLSSVTYPAIAGQDTPFVVEYRYNANSGEVASIGPPSNPSVSYWSATSRDASGRVTSETFDGLVSRTVSYDNVFGQLKGARATVNGTVVQDLTLSYDARGSLATRSDALLPSSESFRYDRLGRLRTWDSESGHYGVAYTYDDIGNLRSRQLTRGGVSDPTEVLRYAENGAGPHQVTGTPWGAYGYDPNGDESTTPGGSVTFGAFHLPLVLAHSGVQTAFQYDALHRRAFKTSSQGNTTYVGGYYERQTDSSGTRHVMHLIVQGRRVGEFVFSDAAPVGPPERHYLLGDQIGSPVVVLGAGGQVIARPRYEPFGRRLASGDTPNIGASGDPAIRFGFAGQEHDDELDLVDMGGRLYDPRAGRFLSADILVSSVARTQAHNRYSYVENNPLTLVDPSGFETETPSSTPQAEEEHVPELEPESLDGDGVSPDIDIDVGSSTDGVSGIGVVDSVGIGAQSSAASQSQLAGNAPDYGAQLDALLESNSRGYTESDYLELLKVKTTRVQAEPLVITDTGKASWIITELGQLGTGAQLRGRPNPIIQLYYDIAFGEGKGQVNYTRWCATFQNYALVSNGYAGSGSARATDLLNSPSMVHIPGNHVTENAIAVVTHPDGSHHSTAVYGLDRNNNDNFIGIGGNQGGPAGPEGAGKRFVQFSSYPIAGTQFVWPIEAGLPSPNQPIPSYDVRALNRAIVKDNPNP